MVDVSTKPATERTAVAEGRVVMSKATLALIESGNAKKGDVLGAARIAGIMAAKKHVGPDPAVSPAGIVESHARDHARPKAAGLRGSRRQSRSPARPESRWRR